MMKKKFVTLGIALMFLIGLGISIAFAEEFVGFDDLKAIYILTPKTGNVVSSPVKVCVDTLGVEVESAFKGVNPGKGHHHFIIDGSLPIITEPKGMEFMQITEIDDNHLHWPDGAECGWVKLKPGRHILQTVFSKGNCVPNNPLLADAIQITVVE